MSDTAERETELAVRRYYAELEKQPLKGTLSLYLAVLSEIRKRWREETIAQLQDAAQRIVPEAALFTVWERLRSAKSESPAVDDVSAYIASLQKAVKALIEEKYDERDVEAIRRLGGAPRRVVDRYDSILRKAS
jgi:hypothetical protein